MVYRLSKFKDNTELYYVFYEYHNIHYSITYNLPFSPEGMRPHRKRILRTPDPSLLQVGESGSHKSQFPSISQTVPVHIQEIPLLDSQGHVNLLICSDSDATEV